MVSHTCGGNTWTTTYHGVEQCVDVKACLKQGTHANAIQHEVLQLWHVRNDELKQIDAHMCVVNAQVEAADGAGACPSARCAGYKALQQRLHFFYVAAATFYTAGIVPRQGLRELSQVNILPQRALCFADGIPSCAHQLALQSVAH